MDISCTEGSGQRGIIFREYTGTFSAEFSAAVFAILASKFLSKKLKPDVKVNSGSWITNNGLDVFSDIFNFMVLFAEECWIDIEKEVLAKLEKNWQKYSVDKAKGKSDKYDKL